VCNLEIKTLPILMSSILIIAAVMKLKNMRVKIIFENSEACDALSEYLDLRELV
tara:strand:- start:4 stop:165 length:162 start_codon:yes stop_codon:yes gene_type:complete